MTLRQRLRFAQRALSAATVPDTPWPAAADGTLLLSCHDVDRSMRDAAGHRFSPLLEGVRQLASGPATPVRHLTHPWAVARGPEVQGGAITLNRRLIALRVRALAARRAGARLALEVALYSQLLQALRPAFVFSIQPPAALCVAARRLGTPLAEVMHGTNVSLSDPVFVGHMALPDEQLPPLIISFDDVTHATVTALTAGRAIRPLRAGDPWLIACRRQRGRGGALPGRRERRVLLTLQWGYDGERDALSNIVPDGILHPALERAIAESGARGWTVLIRMHPIQMNAPGYRHHRRRIEALAARHPHVEVTQATSWPLPLLLDEVAAHMTMSSSAVGEAAVAGVRSLALCPTLHAGGAHHGLFRELEQDGLVAFGRLDAADIARWLDACVPPPRRDTHDDGAAGEREARFYAELIATRGAPAAREVAA